MLFKNEGTLYSMKQVAAWGCCDSDNNKITLEFRGIQKTRFISLTEERDQLKSPEVKHLWR